MIYITAILLGIVEGITEFLPISSTGHLIVAEKLLDFHDVQDVFTVVIQLGAIAAVLWFYRHDLLAKVRGLFKKDPVALHFWKVLVIATIPAGIFGLMLDKSMESISTLTVIGWALIIGGIILWLVDRRPPTRRSLSPQVEKTTIRQALLVGLGQCVAIIPGVSRSGATIVSGLSVGLDRPTATAFSFYLSIPVLVLASAYKLVKHPEAVGQVSGGGGAILVATIVSFMVALASITWLLRYVSRHNFRPFAYYRIIAGLIILLFIA
ncbi:MAG: uppP [Candidatus Saccharibacteria bacterium]|nr:uppP [Candidatus Saccharibacteria bacterium]